MNFKAMFLIAILAISSISVSNAVDFKYESDGTAHQFSTHITGPGLDEQFNNEIRCAGRKTVEVPLILDAKYHITINSKAYRDFGLFKYRWEETGTTKSWDFVYEDNDPVYHIHYGVSTAGDTLFNGGHLKFETRTEPKIG